MRIRGGHARDYLSSRPGAPVLTRCSKPEAGARGDRYLTSAHPRHARYSARPARWRLRHRSTAALASLMAVTSSPCSASCWLATATHNRVSGSLRPLWCLPTSSRVRGMLTGREKVSDRRSHSPGSASGARGRSARPAGRHKPRTDARTQATRRDRREESAGRRLTTADRPVRRHPSRPVLRDPSQSRRRRRPCAPPGDAGKPRTGPCRWGWRGRQRCPRRRKARSRWLRRPGAHRPRPFADSPVGARALRRPVSIRPPATVCHYRTAA